MIEIIKELFINRSDVFSEQSPKGTYSKIERELTNQDIQDHLDGKKTIGVYQLDKDSNVKWVCYDFDGEDLPIQKQLAKNLCMKLRHTDKVESIILEFSGKKGYHVWVFIEPTDATSVKYWAEESCDGYKVHEVFPKQGILDKKKFGNLVKLPLGIHQVVNKRSHFFNEKYEPLDFEQSKEYLKEILNKPKTVIPKVVVKETVRTIIKTQGKTDIPNIVKTLIEKGASEGDRHKNVFIITKELHNAGYSSEEILPLVYCFNNNCNPPKPESIVEDHVKCLLENPGIYLTKDTITEKKDYSENPELELPGSEKLISEFAEENAEILKDKNSVFYRTDARQIIEIGKIKNVEGEEKYLGFVPIIPARFITLVEKYYTPGRTAFTKEKGIFFSKKSLTKELSSILLAAEVLHQELPQIERVFTIPLPILHEDKLTFPEKGYDKRFLSWLPHDAPKIKDTELPLKAAKEIIKKIFHEFCFETEQDYHNAIAALLTPFVRGLFSDFNIRTPVFFYIANRERAGKDYLAGITGIVYEGNALEEPPINTQEKTGNKNEELRKKLLSAFISGRKRMHFSNNKGYINNAVFEGVITSEKYSDRVLGKNEILTFDNEMDFSLSGNTGIGFTPDFGNRCRMIRLFLGIEDANSRDFETPNLHQWVKENRELVLSALFSLVRNWIDKDSPKGTIPFTSFPQWANVCGGIMETAGYLNPCTPDLKVLDVGGDLETNDMKKLFENCFDKKPEEWISKNDIKDIAQDNEDIFTRLDLSSRSGSTMIGMKITKFVRRELSGITLIGRHLDRQTKYQEFRFTKNRVDPSIFDF